MEPWFVVVAVLAFLATTVGVVLFLVLCKVVEAAGKSEIHDHQQGEDPS